MACGAYMRGMPVAYRRVLFAAILAFTLVMAWLPHPPATPLEHYDKVQHAAAFASLAVLAAWAFPATRLRVIGERLSFLGALIEVVQSMPTIHRDCDIKDWIADTLAVLIALLVVAAIRRSLSHSRLQAAPAE